jgi:hypothetical protein
MGAVVQFPRKPARQLMTCKMDGKPRAYPVPLTKDQERAWNDIYHVSLQWSGVVNKMLADYEDMFGEAHDRETTLDRT